MRLVRIHNMNSEPTLRFESKSDCAVMQAFSEVGLGSVIHGYKIPFGGHFLALLQGTLLSLYLETRKQKHLPYTHFDPFHVGVVASFLKSLSPMGKRLTPMLAISMQAFLFSCGSWFSLYLGMTALCLWGFIQPVLIYVLMFGEPLVQAVELFLKRTDTLSNWISSSLIGGVLVVAILKIILGWLVVYKIQKGEIFKEQVETRVREFVTKSRAPIQRTGSSQRDFMKMVFSIPFLLSWAGVILFLYFSGEEKESLSTWVWVIIRPIAIVALIVFLFPKIPLESLRRFPLLQKTVAKYQSWELSGRGDKSATT